MQTANFQELHLVLENLSLHEVDFTMGDAFMSRIGEVGQVISALDTTGEPWVADWLSAEHQKAAALWTAAESNWSKEQADGAGPMFNSRTRALIINYFNKWATDCCARLNAYERSGRAATDVAAWRAALQRVAGDPIRNP